MKRWIGSVFLLACMPSAAWADHSTSQACADAYVHGQKLRNAHKLIEARDAFRSCAQSSCAAFIVKDCSEWLDGVQANIPAVIPIATEDTGNVLSEVKVSMDGTILVTAIDGRSIEVDPGLHTFSFDASDGRTAHTSALVTEGDKMSRVAVKFASVAGAPPPAVTTSAPSVSPTPLNRGPAQRTGATGPWKIIGLAGAALGAVGLGAGAAFGVDAMSKKTAAGCDSQDLCASPAAKTELEAAQRSGGLSTAFFIAGGALAASGVLVWILSPRSSVGTGVGVGTRGTSLVFAGSW
jgi:hypothetical protein